MEPDTERRENYLQGRTILTLERKRGVNELTTSKLRLEVKGNPVTGLLGLCYVML